MSAPVARSAGVGSSSGGIDARERGPGDHHHQQPGPDDPRVADYRRGALGRQAQGREAGEQRRDQQAHRRGEHKALVGRVEQDARSGQRVKGKEAGPDRKASEIRNSRASARRNAMPLV